MESDWREAMAEFYREVDGEIARLAAGQGVTCGGCGECCHFETAGHLLYASRLERRYLRLVSRPADRPDAGHEQLADGSRCQYQQEGKCLAREGRVLGCRLHFCAWPDAGSAQDMAERWHRRLKRLHDELGEEWEYGPMHNA